MGSFLESSNNTRARRRIWPPNTFRSKYALVEKFLIKKDFEGRELVLHSERKMLEISFCLFFFSYPWIRFRDGNGARKVKCLN